MSSGPPRRHTRASRHQPYFVATASAPRSSASHFRSHRRFVGSRNNFPVTMQAVTLPPHILLEVARRPHLAKRLGVKFNAPPVEPISAPPQGTRRDTGASAAGSTRFLYSSSRRNAFNARSAAPKKSPRAARDPDRALTFPLPSAVFDRDMRVRQMEAERRPAAARRLGLSPARGFVRGESRTRNRRRRRSVLTVNALSHYRSPRCHVWAERKTRIDRGFFPTKRVLVHFREKKPFARTLTPSPRSPPHFALDVTRRRSSPASDSTLR